MAINIEDHIIHYNHTLIDALKALNKLRNNAPLTLFAVNDEMQVLGTLTDGDIRRALVNGQSLDCPLGKVMHQQFSFLSNTQYDVKQIHIYREKGIVFIPILDEQMHIVDVVNLKAQKSYLPIDAVLMAGGKGERLRPLTEKIPKPLLPVGDKCIIDHNIDRLISYGIKHINVTVNYLKEQIEKHFESSRNGIKVNTFREPEFLGTIGSIKYVENIHNDAILVMNSDLFTNIDYEDFYLHFLQNDAEMSVAAIPYNVSIPYGILDLDGREIKGILEKPQYNYYANAGIYLIKRCVLNEIPYKSFFNATDLIEKLISEKKKVIRYPLNGTWIDIGNLQEYQKANDLVKHIH